MVAPKRKRAMSSAEKSEEESEQSPVAQSSTEKVVANAARPRITYPANCQQILPDLTVVEMQRRLRVQFGSLAFNHLSVAGITISSGDGRLRR
jgi:hypothetical protein